MFLGICYRQSVLSVIYQVLKAAYKVRPKLCVAAWLRGCVAAWLRGCVAAWLRGCVAAWLRGCVAAWLRGCVAADPNVSAGLTRSEKSSFHHLVHLCEQPSAALRYFSTSGRKMAASRTVSVHVLLLKCLPVLVCLKKGRPLIEDQTPPADPCFDLVFKNIRQCVIFSQWFFLT